MDNDTKTREVVLRLLSNILLSRLLLTALVLLLLAAVAGLIWAHNLTRPVERLSEATREVADPLGA